MIEEVVKRDGTVQKYDWHKIVNAINKAVIAMDGGLNDKNKELAYCVVDMIHRQFKNKNIKQISIEEIQDIVEHELMITRSDVAKAYILYRDKRSREREKNSDLVKRAKDRLIHNIDNRSNANVDEKSFSGKEKEVTSDVFKTLALEYEGLSEDVANAHKDMLIYQHDLEKAVLGEHNCLFINFNELFENGFETRNGDVRKPSNFSTACQQIAVAMQCQSQVQFGGCANMHCDIDLAPFVRMSFFKHFKDGLKFVNHDPSADTAKYNPDLSIDAEVYKIAGEAYDYAMYKLKQEMKQSAEALWHNLNTLESRQGSQVPFTSLDYGRDTSIEGRMVTEAFLNASLSGIGKHHLTSIFPISIFQYKQGVNANEGDENYDLKQLALKSMSKRIYPNWINCDWSQAHETESNPDTWLASMGCRTLVGYDCNGLEYIRQGRGNNVPVTIILPKLGIEYGICLGKRKQADIDGFWKAFEDTLKLAEKALIERFNIMAKQSPNAAPFMYKNNTIQGARECDNNVYDALKHNTLAIGYIGIAEMCQALFGKNHVHDDKVHDFAVSVVRRINEYAKEATERQSLNFSCYATPAEGLSHTALKALRKQYGVIDNVTSHEYLTNSHHCPVWEKVSIKKKLETEAPFCKYPTGGNITYIELDSTFVKNTKAVESIIDYAFKELDIPYLAFNFPIDSCLDCGYQGEFNDNCPECGSSNIQQLRRVTGYLTTDYHNFNDGKQAEVKERVKHSLYNDEES